MATTKNYLDYEGLGKYNAKIKPMIDGKVDKETGKGLSTNDFTTAEKNKLSGLVNYTLPAAADTTLGGVQIPTTSDPVPTNVGLKADASGKAFVDWEEAPKSSTSDYGMIKLGTGFKVNETTGAAEVDPSTATASSVPWSGITDKPDLALKSDLTTVYKYKGSVANVAALPTDAAVGDVYNTEDTGMNYGWTGEAWDALGEVFEITSITDAQIEALFTTQS